MSYTIKDFSSCNFMDDNTSDHWRKKERSLSHSSHSKFLNHCHQMLRSMASPRNNHASANELSTTTNERCRSLFGTPQSMKKAFSVIFHRGDAAAAARTETDTNEMLEFIPCTTSEENLNTIQRLASNISTNPTVYQQPMLTQTTCPTTVHHKLSRWRNKFICRHAHTNYDREKNQGYLVVDTPDSEPVLVPNGSIDHQQTQHAQPCVQTNDISFDLNQIQYSSVPPISPNSSPPRQTYLGVYHPSYEICLRHDLDMQSTRSSIECGVPPGDVVPIEDTQTSRVVPVASSSSTNSSDDKYSGIDRSLLNDHDYIDAQQSDLDLLINYEIDLSKDLSYLVMDLEDEKDFSRSYEETLAENLKLKDELKVLQEEHDSRHFPWSCELCTFINQPFVETGRYVCDICEGPSPLKRATLLQ